MGCELDRAAAHIAWLCGRAEQFPGWLECWPVHLNGLIEHEYEYETDTILLRF